MSDEDDVPAPSPTTGGGGTPRGASPPRRGPSVVIIAAVLAIVVGLVIVGWAIVRTDPEPAPTLSAPDTAVEVVPLPMMTGCWTIQPDERTFVGYRIDEEIVGVPTPSQVTGRTTAVEGGLVVQGEELVGGVVSADLRQLVSDDPERDDALRTRGLETEAHPEALFLLSGSQPIPVPLRTGEPQHLQVSGDLELHGVRRPIVAEVDVQLLGQAPDVTIEVVGSAPVVLSDHDIEPPDVAGVLSVADQGELEVSLRLVRDDALCPVDGGAAPGADPGTAAPDTTR